MPQNRKGAPARSFRPSASDPGARKPGSKSVKHRGHRPGEATPPTGAAKKPRWSADERSDRGRPAERPRGDRAPERDARPPRDGGYSRDARPARDRDERPARDGGASRGGYDRDARPARVGYERPRTDRASGYGKRAADGRPNWEPRDKDTRPKRTDDRPARTFDDRPARTERDDRRPGRASALASRTRHESASSPSSSAREHHGERPTRQLRERAEHYTERPARGYNDGAARHNDDRAGRTPFVHGDDVVLERLEAQAIEASDVDGIGFGDLGLGDNIVRVLAELGAETPFPIQAATIPDVLAGRDVLGRGRTGSGKTIAFGAPLVERLLQLRKDTSPNERREFGRAPQALILAPTRELALQIDRTVQPIARSVGLFTTQIYGGVPYARQLGALQRGVDIIIGTPGRVQDLVNQGKLNLSKVIITVLDEADHMAELGFLEPVQDILNHTKDGGQKLLFSATLDRGVA
ncbi:MAG: DEAD/DEAH box helicase, partial [Pseudolysinimonas sp.]